MERKAHEENICIDLPDSREDPLGYSIMRQVEINPYLYVTWDLEHLADMSDERKEEIIHDFRIVRHLSWDYEHTDDRVRTLELASSEFDALELVRESFLMEWKDQDSPFFKRIQALAKEIASFHV